jgi:hypothetical protein
MIRRRTRTFLPRIFCSDLLSDSKYRNIYFQEGDLVSVEVAAGVYAVGAGVGGYLCSETSWSDAYFWL